MPRYLLIISVAAACLAAGGCGKRPTAMPELRTGAIQITAMDTTSVDSVFIRLDGNEAGERENPCLLEDVIAGWHNLCVYSDTSPGSLFTDLKVDWQDTTDVLFTLRSNPVVGAYVGNIVPDFSAQDIQGNAVNSAADMNSCVILLQFIEYT